MLFKKSNLYNNLIILFLVILFGYILGLSIVNIIDKRLTEISINMPKINMPEQKIYLELKDNKLKSKIYKNNINTIEYDTNKIESFENNKKSIKPTTKKQKKKTKENFDEEQKKFNKCKDIYSKWSKSKNGKKIEKENPDCFEKVNSIRIKNLRNMLDKLKLTKQDNNHCKLIENKLGFVVNPETKKMVYKLFPECEIKNNNKNNNKNTKNNNKNTNNKNTNNKNINNKNNNNKNNNLKNKNRKKINKKEGFKNYEDFQEQEQEQEYQYQKKYN